ncbi:MAG: tyrosine--tRNA ligase [Desulfobacterales bacterium]|nr:tyrosine--tRNA ligase [Desulfobacterales bacterium]MDD4073760.1 tyrosine--tRNA ligase [Desulfobacterales bacterium]MDD4393933.1 tyrosine--tRNA ligase [Desulfobacterales bacterium]
MNVLDILLERGFVEKTTHDVELSEKLKCPVTCYVGFDPTASSLHVGHLLPIMALSHMQRNGHRPIALVGGGTGLVGDPSGKTEMRKLLNPEIVADNVEGLKRQLSHFIEFENDKALLLNNAEWLTKLNYISFLRDIGRYFSVNRMIKAEGYKMRLEAEEGLSFIEFNYMILQAYDFLELYHRYDCSIQMGGSDQWGNIVAGIDLIRRVRQGSAFGITFKLITTSGGAKMGKTAKGAVWLDPSRTSPYDYYQYWINTDDRDVARFLAVFTFLPMNEIKEVEKLKDADLNCAKTVLAFEATLLAHGRQEAVKAVQSSSSMFGSRKVPEDILPSSSMPREDCGHDDDKVPHSCYSLEQFKAGIPAFKLFAMVGLTASGGASRRLIQQGGAYINGERVESVEYMVNENDIDNLQLLLRAGKKCYHKIKIIS